MVEAFTPLADETLATVVEESDLIVSGTVIDRNDRVPIGVVQERLPAHQRDLPGDDETNLYSILTVRVDETLKGADRDSVEIVHLTHLDDAPVRADGESIAEPNDVGVWMLTDLEPWFDRSGFTPTVHVANIIAGEDGTLRAIESDTAVADEIGEFETLDDLLDVLRILASR